MIYRNVLKGRKKSINLILTNYYTTLTARKDAKYLKLLQVTNLNKIQITTSTEWNIFHNRRQHFKIAIKYYITRDHHQHPPPIIIIIDVVVIISSLPVCGRLIASYVSVAWQYLNLFEWSSILLSDVVRQIPHSVSSSCAWDANL